MHGCHEAWYCGWSGHVCVCVACCGYVMKFPCVSVLSWQPIYVCVWWAPLIVCNKSVVYTAYFPRGWFGWGLEHARDLLVVYFVKFLVIFSVLSRAALRPEFLSTFLLRSMAVTGLLAGSISHLLAGSLSFLISRTLAYCCSLVCYIDCLADFICG